MFVCFIFATFTPEQLGGRYCTFLLKIHQFAFGRTLNFYDAEKIQGSKHGGGDREGGGGGVEVLSFRLNDSSDKQSRQEEEEEERTTAEHWVSEDISQTLAVVGPYCWQCSRKKWL